MSSTLLAVALVAAILGLSAVVTHLFARLMYLTCAACRTLNARRRTLCRNCGRNLRKAVATDPQS